MATLVIPDWNRALKNLLTTRPFGEETLFLPVAGKRTDGGPDYSRLFPRDSLTSVFLLQDNHLLEKMLIYFASHQGRKPVAFTAEEPGKISHELPGVNLRKYNTLFSACDTTLLFLIGGAKYAESGICSAEIWKYLVPRMAAGLVYLRAHLAEGIFWEDPTFSGAKDFALKATYWRDDGIPGRTARQFKYPVAFLLVQAQFIAALRAMLELTKSGVFPEEIKRLEGELLAAKKAFKQCFDTGQRPAIAIDSKGPIYLVCSDPLQALWYLDPEDVSQSYIDFCQEILEELKTPWGWKTTKKCPELPGGRKISESIWPWEQAFIAEGAEKHGINSLRETALLSARFLSGTNTPFAEYISLKYGKPHVAGCHIQLWTIAYWAWVERIISAQK